MNRSFFIVASVCCVLFVTMPSSLQAATLTVTNTDDTGAGSLRDTLASVANGDTIDFSVTGTILLTNGELVVTNNIDIVGTDPTALLIDGNGTNRVFHIGPSNVVSISSLTITNGFVSGVIFSNRIGAGIYSDHTALTVSNCVLSGNSADFGGGIYSDGLGGSATLVVINSTIVSNSVPVFQGGGIYNDGSSGGNANLIVANSTLTGNLAGDGGGIFNDGESGRATLLILSTTVKSNSVSSGGGGIYNEGDNDGNGTLIVSNSTVSGNSAAFGGGIFITGSDGTATVQVVSSTLSTNSATFFSSGSGGGIYSGHAALTITNSVLIANTADGSGGALYSDGESSRATVQIINSTLSNNTATNGGGGIFVDGQSDGTASVHIANSTLSGNSASFGGGIYNDAEDVGSTTLTVTNSTLSGNSASFGGSIYIDGQFDGTATVQIAYSTFSGNLATNGSGIFNFEGLLEIGSTILNAGSGTNIESSGGTVLSHGHNLSSDAAGGNGTTAPGGDLNATGDIRNTDPRLGPLQDNGGPTFTHALLTNSPAINAGSDTNSPAADQRGVARPQGAHADIGAFELQDNPPVAVCHNVTVTLVSGCTTNVSVDNGSSDPDLGSTISLSQSPAGPYSAGTNIVTLTVTDNLGATNSCTATVIVIDTIAPAITCPSNKTAQATSPAGAVVSFADPVANDNCSVTVSCAPPSGSIFPIGDTVVQCTATDASGNTASCTFSVHVKNSSEQLVDTEQVILGLGIDAKVKKSVLKKFQKVEKQINTDHTRTACKQLQKLLVQVQRELFKERLTNDQAIQITTPLIRALTVLGCS